MCGGFENFTVYVYFIIGKACYLSPLIVRQIAYRGFESAFNRFFDIYFDSSVFLYIGMYDLGIIFKF